MYKSVSMSFPSRSIVFPSSFSTLYLLVFPVAPHQVGLEHHCGSGVTLSCSPARCCLHVWGQAVFWLLLPPGSRQMQARGCMPALCLAEAQGSAEAQAGSLCCCNACTPPSSMSKVHGWKPPPHSCTLLLSGTGLEQCRQLQSVLWDPPCLEAICHLQPCL